MKKLLSSSPVTRINQFYKSYSKYQPIAFFIGGFLWDSITLTRIDRLSDNLILLAYLFMLGLSIFLVNYVESDLIGNRFILKYKKWYPLAIQFFLGGLFSSYVVFYFQSAALTKNWLFLGILIILLFANEFLKKRLTNIYLQLILYFLASFAFFNFFIPVIVKRMNIFMFIVSGILSLGIIGLFLGQLFYKRSIIKRNEALRISLIILGLFFLLNIAYFKNWIPPVPLSLKYGGIYHQVARTEDAYLLKFEKPSWYNFWKKSDNPFHHAERDTVYCFAAVFAPVELKKHIFHIWQQKESKSGRWLITDRLKYIVVGGRKAGYRGYTYKRHIVPGEWRVDVQTDDGQILGRISFEIDKSVNLNRKFKTIVYE
jgi:hypothetical protein